MSRTARLLLRNSRRYRYSTRTRFAPARSIQYVERDSIEGFDADTPAVFKQSFKSLPAIEKWFTPSKQDEGSLGLYPSYLHRYGDAIVPLELTRTTPESSSFERFEAPLSLLLAYMGAPDTPDTRLYLAQYPLTDLPTDLRPDLPTPSLISQLGRGDIYASSLWMGKPPTRTPLHRDPNPNLFVQLAGQKVVRMLRPNEGRELYENVKTELGTAGGRANMRGDEMMQGEEMEALEDAVWGDSGDSQGVQAELQSGDGLYIPVGWWHAVHGVGQGPNASANWWFR